MEIYIASSWKNQHAVEMLTVLLRSRGHEVLSFVENNHGEYLKTKDGKPLPFDEWVFSVQGDKSFAFDTNSAMHSDLVVYVGPSGKDAAAEVGMAWAKGVPVVGLHAKGEDFGLMRRLIRWFTDYRDLLSFIGTYEISMLKVER